MEEDDEDPNKSKGSESSDSENNCLKIAMEEAPSTPKRKVKKNLQFDGSALDKTIEETIEKCENFTPDVAKKMLLKLIKNEHILALSVLKAEEDEKKSSDSDDEDKKSEVEAPTTPKLTRLKAKQLNQTLPVPGSLKSTEPCEDVVALIQAEMKSDDEDDEYQPCEEDALSDEDITNTTFSDLESQPSTPGSALLYNEQDFDSPTKDVGDFKVPKTRLLSAEEQENISRRTRSKLCLTTTAIETIESTFIPPDITTDMYDFDQDHEIDNEWKEFLNEFMMPLTNAEDDDEKSDPEYVASEAAPMDKEELRPVRVSKKELNQLISELLEDSCNALTFDPEPTTSSKRSSSDGQWNKNKRQRNSSPSRNKSQSPRVSSRMFLDEELLSTPPPPLYLEPKNLETTPKPLQDEIFVTPFFQTPQRMGFCTPTLGLSPATYSFPSPVPVTTPPPAAEAPITLMPDPKFPQITGVYGSLPAEASPAPSLPTILVMNAQNQLEICSSSNLFTQAFNNNGIVQLPQFQSVVIQVPTIDLLQNRLNLSSVISPPAIEAAKTSLEPKNLTDDSKKRLVHRAKRYIEFEYLETEPPPVEKVFDASIQGMTFEQKAMYEQQMRMHAQFLSQHYLQIYASPKWWEKAAPIKKNLEELKEIVKPETSPSTANHILECLEMCYSWEKELEENNERNKKYAEFLYTEVEFDERSHEKKNSFKGKFHNRLMEHALSSKAILYPQLLPERPFRVASSILIEPVNGELRLIAFGIERFYKELYDKLNRLSPRQIREPKMTRIAASIIREYKSFRKESDLIAIIDRYKVNAKINPIKYYFIHKKAPAFKYVIEDVNLEKLVPPKQLRRGLLPKVWDTYMFSYQRLQIYPYQQHDEEPELVEDLTLESEVEEISETSQPEIEEIPAPQPENQTISVDSSYKIEIIYDDIPKINICFIPTAEALQTPEKVSCISLLSNSPVKAVREKSNVEKQNNLISILKKVSDNLVKSPAKKKSVNFLLPSPPRNRSSPRFKEKTKAIGNDFVLTQKFFIVIENYFSNYVKNLQFRTDPHPALRRIFHWTKTIDIYAKFLQQSIMMSKKRQNESGSAESGPKPKKNVSSSDEYSKKLHRKITDNRNLIMQSSRNKCTIEKDCSYAYNYLERVKKTMTENGDDELYTEFMSMLTSFDPDYETVPELYNKMETLLMPNYSDLLDLFLTFMLPEHAAEIGKFFEHFVLENMKNLLQKLNTFFNKQPSHMKKVYACLNELSNEKDLTMERLKAKILPLLKGNQLLNDWFLELFDKPPESLASEFESVYIKKSLSDSDNSVDNYEEIHSKDLIECKNIDELNTCGVRYKNGKIMYHHGTLLPAKISFLAHDAPSVASVKKDEETSLCVHEIRNHVKFNDPKKSEESGECSKKSGKKVKKFKLCDSQTLHAHAVRLNPVHAQPGEKLSDLAHLLTPPNPQNGSGEDKNSPKKTRTGKKSPKKTVVNSKSPSSSSGNSVTISPPISSSPSKALQSAKKLQKLVEETDEPAKKKQKTVEDLPAMPKLTTSLKIAEKPLKKLLPKTDIPTPSTSKKSDEEEKSESDDKRGTGGWTREEDKLILEEFKIGYETTEALLDALLKKLSRSRAEIGERYEFLLDILMMIKN